MARGPVADLLAVGVLAVSVFCAGRLLVALLWGRPAERAVDIVHVVMGVSMAGMLTGWLTGVWNDAWTMAFIGSTLWFGGGIVQQLSSRSPSVAAARHLPHFVASAAMLYMLLNMRWSPMGASGMHPMGSSSASPVLPVLLAVLLVGDAMLAAGRSFLPMVAMVQSEHLVVGPQPEPIALGAWDEDRALPLSRVSPVRELAPRATSVCLVVMSFAMAYMFITVRP